MGVVGASGEARPGAMPSARSREASPPISVTPPRAVRSTHSPPLRLRSVARPRLLAVRSLIRRGWAASLRLRCGESVPRGVRPPGALRFAQLHYGRQVAKESRERQKSSTQKKKVKAKMHACSDLDFLFLCTFGAARHFL